MKALAIDSSASCITIAAKNENNTVTLTLDIGMRQSEKILPAIDTVLKEAELTPSELDYTALAKGPGTFTGLRLAFAALKAIELSHAVPVYGVGTLELYAYPYRALPHKVISVIDAKKEQFFAAVYDGKDVLFEAQDTDLDTILDFIEDGETVIVTGADAALFSNTLRARNSSITTLELPFQGISAQSLFMLAEEQIAKKMPPLQAYEGPAYMRKSEAELALERKVQN